MFLGIRLREILLHIHAHVFQLPSVPKTRAFPYAGANHTHIPTPVKATPISSREHVDRTAAGKPCGTRT